VTGGLLLELDRTFDAPREQVFRSLTEPARLAAWWGPRGFTTPEIDVDLRVGGAYRFGMQPPDGALFHLAGEFLEVARPTRLVYTFRWEEPAEDDVETVVRLLLDVVDDGTALTLRHGEFATEARRALHRDGWTDSFDKLQAVLADAATGTT
jgi:uncharacterized protein YndB with AHSA1/START domain